VRKGAPGIRARTQDSIAVSAKAGSWILCNTSPDIRQQIEAFSELHPRAPRHSPISAIVLTNGDLDHVLGLFSLRESYPLVVYATEAVRSGLVDHNVLMRTLERFEGQLTWRRLTLDVEVPVVGHDGQSTGVWVTARAVKGKVPVHLEGVAGHTEEDNVGLWLRDASGAVVAYVSAAAELEPIVPHVQGIEALLLDGTFWSSDELSAPGLAQSRAEDMAHLPIGGPHGSLSHAPRLSARQRIYTHINNTNPILVDGSEQRRALERAGFQLAWDGMDFGSAG
jgi:pyrroloquinoline quinone biosynthesis protein B